MGLSVRSFIALELPHPLSEGLSALSDTLPKGLRVVPDDDLHLTLAFLGDASESALQDIADDLDTLTSDPIALGVTGIGTFGSGDMVRSVNAIVQPTDALSALQTKVIRIARNAGLGLPRRKFLPHITLARRTERPPEAALSAWLLAHTTHKTPPVWATRGVLFRSDLTGNGPIYTALSEFEFSPDYAAWEWD
ncbi:MAG: RNA 2',3'-cyclic phosphodiesterase [Pseudomonadota bacterium]